MSSRCPTAAVLHGVATPDSVLHCRRHRLQCVPLPYSEVCLSKQHKHSEDPEAHASGAYLLRSCEGCLLCLMHWQTRLSCLCAAKYRSVSVRFVHRDLLTGEIWRCILRRVTDQQEIKMVESSWSAFACALRFGIRTKI